MKQSIVLLLFAAFVASTVFVSCDAIAGIFKAGMGFGIFLVVLVIIVIVVIAARVGRRK